MKPVMMVSKTFQRAGRCQNLDFPVNTVTIRERQDQGAVGDKGFRAVHGGEDLGNQDRLACLASRALHFIHNYLQI
jgi:hypothetical protein